MRKLGLFILTFGLLALILIVIGNKGRLISEKSGEIKITMKITSPAFENNTKIPSKYTCDGENINPPLIFSDIPNRAKSLVLIMDDPDAPFGTWVHWVVFNINPKTSGVSENSVFSGAKEGVTSFGKKGYGGPCPPSGTHRYFFKLYALDTVLNLTDFDKTTLEKTMQNHILDKTELIGLYSR